jgi:hypothetical protein
MKQLLVFAITALFLSACGKSKDPASMAKAYCDCNKKIAKMDAADPKRADAVKDCFDKQLDAREAFEKDPEKMKEYNRLSNECAAELFNESQGK